MAIKSKGPDVRETQRAGPKLRFISRTELEVQNPYPH